MATSEATLSSLSVNKDVTRLEQSSGPAPASGSRWGGSGAWGAGLVLFIVLVIIVFVIIVATRPNWIVKHHGGKSSSDECSSSRDDKCDIDYGRALLWSIVIAIGLLILFWILYALAVGMRC